MKLELHHINLSSDKVDEMNNFYLKVMQLKTENDGLPVLQKKKKLAKHASPPVRKNIIEVYECVNY